MKKIFVFDFDGTITHADTLLAFIRFACGPVRMCMGFALYAPLLVLMKLKLYPNYKAKQKVFAHFFRGMTLTRFDALCTAFAQQGEHLLRPAARSFINTVRSEAYAMAIVSASIDNWVRPFAELYLQSSNSQDNSQNKSQSNPQDNSQNKSQSNPQSHKPSLPIIVLGTKVEVDAAGCLTGRFSTPNCYGPEKVRRIEAVWPHREQYDVSAFGDSRGDKEMLAYADQAYFKPFRF